MRRRIAVLALAVVAALLAVAGPAGAAAERTTVPVRWHAQQASLGNVGPVAGAEATVVRTNSGVGYRFHARGLQAGNAYTLWVVVVNNPGACAASPCSGGDILLNAATDSQVLFGAGHVAGAAGNGTFAGSVAEGPLQGWLADRGLHDATTAEVHLVLNDHGPALAEYLPGMIRTYRGGCSDASPFPAIYPQSALADGEPGPNICRLYQAAIFTA